MKLEEAMRSRMSVRAFTSQDVAVDVIEDILNVAARAPSGANTQPWRVYVLRGESRNELVRKVVAAHQAMQADPALSSHYREEYDYYPPKWFSPYIERRRENGWGLYGLLGIAKTDGDRMRAQQQRNFELFDAPVGLMFTLDRGLGRGALLDYGMFLQNVMLAARGHGLHTCPQAAWNAFGKIVLPHVGAQEQEMLVCGMALGYADANEVVNTFHTPRVTAAEFARWLT